MKPAEYIQYNEQGQVSESRTARVMAHYSDLPILHHMAKGRNAWKAVDKISPKFNTILYDLFIKKSEMRKADPDDMMTAFYEHLLRCIYDGGRRGGKRPGGSA